MMLTSTSCTCGATSSSSSSLHSSSLSPRLAHTAPILFLVAPGDAVMPSDRAERLHLATLTYA